MELVSCPFIIFSLSVYYVLNFVTFYKNLPSSSGMGVFDVPLSP